VYCHGITGKENIYVTRVNKRRKVFTCARMNNCRPGHDQDFAVTFAYRFNLPGDLPNHQRFLALARYIAPHEGKTPLPIVTFYRGNPYAPVTNDHLVPLGKRCYWTTSCLIICRVNYHDTVHFDVFYRNPLSVHIHVCINVRTGIEPVGTYPVLGNSGQRDGLTINGHGTQFLELVNNLVKQFTRCRSNFDPDITRIIRSAPYPHFAQAKLCIHICHRINSAR
jgi:hypothetical protein